MFHENMKKFSYFILARKKPEIVTLFVCWIFHISYSRSGKTPLFFHISYSRNRKTPFFSYFSFIFWSFFLDISYFSFLLFYIFHICIFTASRIYLLLIYKYLLSNDNKFMEKHFCSCSLYFIFHISYFCSCSSYFIFHISYFRSCSSYFIFHIWY